MLVLKITNRVITVAHHYRKIIPISACLLYTSGDQEIGGISAEKTDRKKAWKRVESDFENGLCSEYENEKASSKNCKRIYGNEVRSIVNIHKHILTNARSNRHFKNSVYLCICYTQTNFKNYTIFVVCNQNKYWKTNEINRFETLLTTLA